MKIDNLTFIPHRLRRRSRWQTASYTADYVDVFYVKIQTDDGVTGIGAGSIVPNGRGGYPCTSVCKESIKGLISG